MEAPKEKKKKRAWRRQFGKAKACALRVSLLSNNHYSSIHMPLLFSLGHNPSNLRNTYVNNLNTISALLLCILFTSSSPLLPLHLTSSTTPCSICLCFSSLSLRAISSSPSISPTSSSKPSLFTALGLNVSTVSPATLCNSSPLERSKLCSLSLLNPFAVSGLKSMVTTAALRTSVHLFSALNPCGAPTPRLKRTTPVGIS